MSLLCRACGLDLSTRKFDRTLLSGPTVDDVRPLITQVLEEQVSLVGVGRSISDVSHMIRGGYICRCCLRAYRTHKAQRQKLQEKAVQALSVIQIAHSQPSGTGSSRKRPSDTNPAPRAKRSLFSWNPVSVSTNDQPQSCASQSRSSPSVAVEISYACGPKTYVLTPSRRTMVKQLTRGSIISVARQCLKNTAARKSIIKSIGHMIRREVMTLCSESVSSVLSVKSTDAMEKFTWDALIEELQRNAPVFLQILQICTKSSKHRLIDQNAIIGVCCSLLCRYRSQRMNLLQRVISVILYAGHANKQVFARLQKLALCMSHMSTIRLIDRFGVGHDSAVMQWREDLMPSLVQAASHSGSTRMPAVLDNTFDMSSIDLSETEQLMITSTPLRREVQESFLTVDLSPVTEDNSNVTLSDQSLLTDTQSVTTISETTSEHPQRNPVEHISASASIQKPNSFKLVGDNIDKQVSPRYVRSDCQKKSLHYFHVFAVLDRISFTHLSDSLPLPTSKLPKDIAQVLLPSTEDDQTLRKNFATHVTRILTTHMPSIKLAYEEAVDWHIEHMYMKEMSTKSTVVPLGVFPKCENKSDEMLDILLHFSKYIPQKEAEEHCLIASTGEEVPITTIKYHQVLFGGDQLTCQRVRGVQRAMQNADKPSLKCEGFVPVNEDWHSKLCLMGVIWKRLYSTASADQHGTMYQLRNLLHRTNVPKKPKANFNACEDFLTVIVTGHVLAAAMKVLKMSTLEDLPSSEFIPIWTADTKERREAIERISLKIVDEFVDFTFHKKKSTASKHNLVISYATELLSLGLFFQEYSDSVREGDGIRVLRCWRYLLPLFIASQRKNYSIEAFNFLYQYHFMLSPRQAQQLIWDRFVNTQGKPGRNIPADLHLEHLNRLVKGAIGSLGSNKTESCITRVGRAIGTLQPVLDQYDVSNRVTHPSGSHMSSPITKDCNILVKELTSNVYSSTSRDEKHRKYDSFVSVKDSLLQGVTHTQLINWITSHLPPSK